MRAVLVLLDSLRRDVLSCSECADRIKCGRYLSRTDYPVSKIPSRPMGGASGPLDDVWVTRLFDLACDPCEQENLAGKCPDVESRMLALLDRAMREADSPPEQWRRLGMA